MKVVKGVLFILLVMFILLVGGCFLLVDNNLIAEKEIRIIGWLLLANVLALAVCATLLAFLHGIRSLGR